MIAAGRAQMVAGGPRWSARVAGLLRDLQIMGPTKLILINLIFWWKQGKRLQARAEEKERRKVRLQTI